MDVNVKYKVRKLVGKYISENIWDFGANQSF
jgi:hypothetical protein